jgi:hypothetical protein
MTYLDRVLGDVPVQLARAVLDVEVGPVSDVRRAHVVVVLVVEL